VQNVEAALKVISRFEDAVIKPVFGYKGKDIARVKDGKVQFSDRKIESSSMEAILNKLLEERGNAVHPEVHRKPGKRY